MEREPLSLPAIQDSTLESSTSAVATMVHASILMSPPDLRRLPGRETIPRVINPRTGWQQTILMIGSLGPLGHCPASGTVTVAVVGLPLYWLSRGQSWIIFTACTLVVTLAAVWLHARGDRILEQQDSRVLVWDEVVGFLIAVAFVPFTWQLAILAFLIERVIDIVKVPPANWIEKGWKGGWGVVGDDVIAGLYTCGLLHLIVRVAPAWVGLNA